MKLKVDVIDTDGLRRFGVALKAEERLSNSFVDSPDIAWHVV